MYNLTCTHARTHTHNVHTNAHRTSPKVPLHVTAVVQPCARCRSPSVDTFTTSHTHTRARAHARTHNVHTQRVLLSVRGEFSRAVEHPGFNLRMQVTYSWVSASHFLTNIAGSHPLWFIVRFHSNCWNNPRVTSMEISPPVSSSSVSKIHVLWVGVASRVDKKNVSPVNKHRTSN